MSITRSTNRFVPEMSAHEKQFMRAESWAWVPRIQVVAAIYLLSNAMYGAFSQSGLASYGWGILALLLLVWFTGEAQKLLRAEREMMNVRFTNFERRFTEFICDAALGNIERDNLIRIREAASRTSHGGHQPVLEDDFSLMSRAWYFWRYGNGFEWQDSSICVNCQLERRAHAKDGTCPA